MSGSGITLTSKHNDRISPSGIFISFGKNRNGDFDSEVSDRDIRTNCKNCGAAIDVFKVCCPYCKTSYRGI